MPLTPLDRLPLPQAALAILLAHTAAWLLPAALAIVASTAGVGAVVAGMAAAEVAAGAGAVGLVRRGRRIGRRR